MDIEIWVSKAAFIICIVQVDGYKCVIGLMTSKSYKKRIQV